MKKKYQLVWYWSLKLWTFGMRSPGPEDSMRYIYQWAFSLGPIEIRRWEHRKGKFEKGWCRGCNATIKNNDPMYCTLCSRGEERGANEERKKIEELVKGVLTHKHKGRELTQHETVHAVLAVIERGWV